MRGGEFIAGDELLGATEVPAVLGATSLDKLREMRGIWFPGEYLDGVRQPEIPKPDPIKTPVSIFGEDLTVID
jgi:hypothetical protein